MRIRIGGPTAILALLALLVWLSSGEQIVPGDAWLGREIQRFHPAWLDGIVAATNWLGNGALKGTAVTLAVALPLLVFGYRAEALLMVLAGLARLLNTPIKELLASPRPATDEVNVLEEALGFGFPSGHAFGAVLFFGALMIVIPAVVRRRALAIALQALCVVAILFTGYGRIVVGAHYPTDVLGGYLIGLVLLWPLGWLYRTYRWKINLRPGLFYRPGRRPAPPYGGVGPAPGP